MQTMVRASAGQRCSEDECRSSKQCALREPAFAALFFSNSGGLAACKTLASRQGSFFPLESRPGCFSSGEAGASQTALACGPAKHCRRAAATGGINRRLVTRSTTAPTPAKRRCNRRRRRDSFAKLGWLDHQK